MFGRSKYCSVCGKKLNGRDAYDRFGLHFCSEVHANWYLRAIQSSNEIYSLLETRSECLEALSNYYRGVEHVSPAKREWLKDKIDELRLTLKETNHRLLELEEHDGISANVLKE